MKNFIRVYLFALLCITIVEAQESGEPEQYEHEKTEKASGEHIPIVPPERLAGQVSEQGIGEQSSQGAAEAESS